MTQDTPNMLDAARSYHQRGYAVVPVGAGKKNPTVKDWPNFRIIDESDFDAHFDCDTNIGLLLGNPSGALVDIDLDCPEAVDLADLYLPPTEVITGRTRRPRSHRWYICPGIETARITDPSNKSVIVEIRSDGAQTVVGPSVHPDGDRYDILFGEPTVVDAEELTAAVNQLREAVLIRRHGAMPTDLLPHEGSRVPPPDTNQDALDRAGRYLDAMPPAISGRSGHSATYAAATAMVHGFGLSEHMALDLLSTRFNPRCRPPWEPKELAHKVEDAGRKPHNRPYGWLLNAERIVRPTPAPKTQRTDSHVPQDPGSIPTELLRVPGFIGELVDATLSAAPYPNPVMAFSGALALQSVLSGGLVRDSGDNRTNLYILAVGHSGIGKDAPRKMNASVLHRAGLSDGLAQQLGSGEGLQDALKETPNLLVQSDEFDTLLQSMNRSKDGRFESLMALLLSAYTSANSVLPMRRLAGKKGGVIDQPHLVLYGSAIPNHYYAALTERTLTNGLFARMLVFEAGQRGDGQEAGILKPPKSVIEAAVWWAEQQRVAGADRVPNMVEATPEATKILAAFRQALDQKYKQASETNDAVGTTVWARGAEHARKLALLYAVSEDHQHPSIGPEAAMWATQLVSHLIERMLFMAAEHAADSAFDELAKKVLRKIRSSPNGTVDHSSLLKRSKLDARTFADVMETLVQRGDVTETTIQTTGRRGRIYTLVDEGEEGVNEVPLRSSA